MNSSSSILIDSYGRQLDYLRLSVTDRCNLRCQYCMPQEGIDFVPRNELLSYEDMLRLAHIFKSLGVKKIRITGGEPFARKDLCDFLKALRHEVKMPQIHITTNGTLIEKFIGPILDAQIDGFNVSIDSLNPHEFKRMTRRDEFENAWNGITLLQEHGIKSQINVVVQRGFNDNEILPFVELSQKPNTHVRFIESMPFNGSCNPGDDLFVSANEMLATIKSRHKNLERLEQKGPSSAESYRVPGYQSTVAIIPALSRTMCGTCNRIRLTATGDLKTCLYADPYLNLKRMILEGASDIDLKQTLISAVKHKYKDGFEAENARVDRLISESMSSIGG